MICALSAAYDSVVLCKYTNKINCSCSKRFQVAAVAGGGRGQILLSTMTESEIGVDIMIGKEALTVAAHLIGNRIAYV